MISVWTIVLLAILASLALPWLKRRQEHFEYFKRRGIAGPQPSVWFGNAVELYSKGQPQAVRDWSREFGDVFGYFNGRTPVIVVLDAALIREIQMSKFDSFADRGLISTTSMPLARTVCQLTGSRWRASRNLIDRAFSQSNISKLSDTLTTILDEYGEHLEEAVDAQSTIDLSKLIKAYCTEVYCIASIGQNYGIVNDLRHAIINILEDLSVERYSLPLVLLESFPSISNWVLTAKGVIDTFLDSVAEVDKETLLRQQITNDINEAIRVRRHQQDTGTIDLLQFLIDAHHPEMTSTADNIDIPEGVESHDNWQNNKTMPQRGYSDAELLDNAWMLLTMSESTSAALSGLCFALMKYPDVQEKLRTELLELFATAEAQESIDITTLLDATYLNAVFKESLRLHPPAFQITRKPIQNVTLHNGLKVTPADLLCIPVATIQRKDEFFSEPDVFRPERFLETQIDPIAFQAFGNGPRHCVGIKFVEAILKLTICRLLLTYRLAFSGMEQPDEQLEMLALTTIQRPAKPLMVRLELLLPTEEVYSPPPEPVQVPI